MSVITLKQLFEAGVYFGHQTRFREPKMSPYIYGVRHRISIINLEITKPLLNEAAHFASKLSARVGSKILFVGTKRAARDAIKEQAKHCNMPYVNHRWLGGILTNYRTIRQSIKRLKELEVMSQDGSFDRLTKKEAGRLQHEMDKLERSVGGIKDMGGLPDALFIIDVGYEHIAVSEAQKLKIPIIGVVDTNHSPEGIDYVIPGNDDAARAILLYTTVMAEAILAGRASNTVTLESISESSLESSSDKEVLAGVADPALVEGGSE